MDQHSQPEWHLISKYLAGKIICPWCKLLSAAQICACAHLASSMCRVQRLPGMESSRLGLDSLTGRLDDFDFGDYLNMPAESEATPTDMHSMMEAQLKLATKPANRGI